MQHIEFFHTNHFEQQYHRTHASGELSAFIDFFWETDFDDLWQQYPDGFSDALFPNIGYTYLVNLGTPFVMQLEEELMPVRGDGFLPRNKYMVCHHRPGNRIFGIKFKVSPVLFQKNVNFREYREYIFPLAYLIDRQIVEQVKEARDFSERVRLLCGYYEAIIAAHGTTLQTVSIVTGVLAQCGAEYRFAPSIEAIAAQHGITTRTLQRYFEKATGSSCKQALQLLRIRMAVSDLLHEAGAFDHRRYGYYDYSHFHKHLTAFLNHRHINLVKPHLQLRKQIDLPAS